MDLNFKRRKADRAIAREAAEQLFFGVRSALSDGATSVPIELIAHHFGIVCKRHNLDGAAALRAYGYVDRSLVEMLHELDAAGRKFAEFEKDLSTAIRRG
jgi:hypothetical protein